MYNCYTPRIATRAPPAPPSAQAATSSGGERRRKTATASSATGGEPARADDRAWNQLRPLFIDLGVVSQASGSAYLELEHTKVLVAVYGPKPRQDVEFSEDGKLLCDFRYAPFARLVGGHRQKKERGGRDGGGGGGPQQEEERAASQVIAQALEASAQLAKLPKSVIEIYVSVLQADGGEVGAAITCASLALADAGIELFGLVASCGVVAAATAPSSGGGRGGWRVHLDPTATEEEDEGGREGEGGVLGLALMPASGEVTQLWQEGRLDGTAMERALEVATDGALMVHAMMRKRLLKAVVSAAGGGGEGGRRSSSSSSLLLSSS